MVDKPPSEINTTTLLNPPSLVGKNRAVRLVLPSAGKLNAMLGTGFVSPSSRKNGSLEILAFAFRSKPPALLIVNVACDQASVSMVPRCNDAGVTTNSGGRFVAVM